MTAAGFLPHESHWLSDSVDCIDKSSMEPFNSRDKGENGLPEGGGLQLELSGGFVPDTELVRNWRGVGDFCTSAKC